MSRAAGDRAPTIPQADVLPKLRALIEKAVASGDFHEAGRAVGLTERHVGYYAAAAEALGLVKREGRRFVVLPLGHRLRATRPHTREEAGVWRQAIEESAVVRSVHPDVLGKRAPTKHVLAQAIMAAGHTRLTAERRAETLLRWRQQVLAAETQGVLPVAEATATFAAGVRYSVPLQLRSLRIHSFKAFGEPSGRTQRGSHGIPLEPLTVFFGPNGAGKSTILQAVDVLGALVRGNITEMLSSHGWDYADLPHLRSSKQTITIEAELITGDTVVEWHLTLGARKYPGVAAELVRTRGRDRAEWTVLLERKGRSIQCLRESTGDLELRERLTLAQSWLSTLEPREDATHYPGLLAVKAWAEQIHAFWSLNPAVLRAKSRAGTREIGAHGEDIASFLFHLRKHRPQRFAAFTNRVRRYYPRLVDIQTRSGQYGWKHLEITERWNGEKATFNAHQVSDGLLRMMAVASLPEWEKAPSLLLLDEVENGLHPRLLGGIADLLREISATTQVLATTHSPITLNYVDPRAARLVTRGRGGGVVVTPLTETKDYERLRRHFEPGELWYNAGEQHLVGARRS